MKDYLIRVENGHHVVNMKPSFFELAAETVRTVLEIAERMKTNEVFTDKTTQ